MSNFTSKVDFEEAYSTLFSTFKSGKTKSLAWRKWQLKQCWWMIEDNEDAIIRALTEDLHRHAFETYISDIHGLRADLIEHLKHLEEWAGDEMLPAGVIFGTLGKARIRKEPLGVSLIIGAWNFPVILLLQPMIAAISAGCCVMLKPSELAVASQQLLEKLVPRYLDSSAIRLVTGGPPEMSHILEHKFDQIFFTGSNKIARFITAAAAKHLTPVVLELGGQGPAIVTKTANIDLAAKRICYAKFMNAGQICLSVNHVFADPAIYDELITRLAHWNEVFLEKGTGHYSQIINERNFDRLTHLLKQSEGKITSSGNADKGNLMIMPTIVANVTIQDSLLSDELFGPICPVIKADYVQAYQTIGNMPHPLGIYIFSSSQSEIDEILSNTNSGGATINDVMMHAAVPTAPFGGVGESGYGYYHGKHGFNTFSHTRTVVAPPTWLDKVMSFRYPPYDIKNKSKIEVKNTLGFKRGETMGDQKIVRKQWGGMNMTVATVALVALLVVLDGRTGAKMGLVKALDGLIVGLRKLLVRG